VADGKRAIYLVYVSCIIQTTVSDDGVAPGAASGGRLLLRRRSCKRVSSSFMGKETAPSFVLFESPTGRATARPPDPFVRHLNEIRFFLEYVFRYGSVYRAIRGFRGGESEDDIFRP